MDNGAPDSKIAAAVYPLKQADINLNTRTVPRVHTHLINCKLKSAIYVRLLWLKHYAVTLNTRLLRVASFAIV